MPTLSLLESLGLPDPAVVLGRPAVTIFELAAIVVVALALAVVSTRNNRSRVVTAVAMLLPFVLFARFAISEFDSYRQWKAMAFAAPFTVITVVVLIAVAARSFADLGQSCEKRVPVGVRPRQFPLPSRRCGLRRRTPTRSTPRRPFHPALGLAVPSELPYAMSSANMRARLEQARSQSISVRSGRR